MKKQLTLTNILIIIIFKNLPNLVKIITKKKYLYMELINCANFLKIKGPHPHKLCINKKNIYIEK